METHFLRGPDAPSARRLFDAIGSKRLLGFDVETHFDPGRSDAHGEVVTWQVADEATAWVVDARGWPLADPLVARWLEDADAPKAVHYGAFELAVCARMGVTLRRIVDTFVLARLLTAGLEHHDLDAIGVPNHKLATLARVVLGVDLDKSLQTSFRSGEVPSEAQVRYAGLDAWATRELAVALRDEAGRAGLLDAMRLELRFGEVVARMQHTGVPVDPDAWWAVCSRAFDDAARHERAAALALNAPLDVFGEPSGFNPNANAQVQELLRAQGIELADLSEAALAQCPHSAAAHLLAYRRAKRVADWAAAPSGRGRIFSSFTSIGTGTGRMTCHEPNVLAIPSELLTAVRAAPGNVLVRADYGKQELYVLASQSEDEGLAAALRSGDPYANVAERIGVARSLAKVAVLATAYGAGRRAIAAQVGCSASDAAALIASLRRAYPKAMEYCRGAVRLTAAPDRGHGLLVSAPAMTEIRCRLRRRLVAPGRYGNWGNTLVQSSAADMTKLASVRASRGVEAAGGALVLVVHDELVAEVPARSADEALESIRAAMASAARDVLGERSPLPPLEAGIGETLADAKRTRTPGAHTEPPATVPA